MFIKVFTDCSMLPQNHLNVPRIISITRYSYASYRFFYRGMSLSEASCFYLPVYHRHRAIRQPSHRSNDPEEEKSRQEDALSWWRQEKAPSCGCRALIHWGGNFHFQVVLANRLSFMFYEAIISESSFHLHSMGVHIPKFNFP